MGCVFSEILKISLNVGYQTAWLFLHNLVAFTQAWHTASLNRRALKAPGPIPKSQISAATHSPSFLMKQLLFFNKHHLICSISCGTTTSISTCRTTASHTIDEHLNIALWNAYPFFQCCVVLCKVRRILTALPKHVQSDSNPGNMLANPWCWAAAQFFEMNTNQLNEFQLKFVIFLFWPPCL